MSWHCSQALAAEFSQRGCLDAALCARLNESRTAAKSLCDGKRKVSFRRFRSGATLKPSTASRGVARWISSLRGSPVKTFQSRATVPGLTANGPGNGEMSCASFVKFSPRESTWKTHRCLFPEDLPESSVILPRWGSMRGGVVTAGPDLEPPPMESGSGLSLIRPTARDWKGPSGAAFRAKYGNHNLADCLGGTPNPEFSEWVMGWPIGWTDLAPLATDSFRRWRRGHFTSWEDNQAGRLITRGIARTGGRGRCSPRPTNRRTEKGV